MSSQQRKRPATPPAATPEQQLFVAIQRLASGLGQQAVELLRPHGLSMAQYNVLRVLRGARAGGECGEEGLPCGAIGERLITKDPDVTRLLDRLERQGLIARTRGQEDRRVVTATVTEEGLRLLAELDEPMMRLHEEQFTHLGPERVRQLRELVAAATPND